MVDLVLSYHGPQGLVPALSIQAADFAAGEITGVIGPSGCGKTSLLYALAGFFHTYGEHRRQGRVEGKICIDGQEQQGLRRQTAIIFQDFGLLPWKTVTQNVELPLRLKHCPKSERQQRVHHFLSELGLSDSASFYPARLSGGMKQRTALARALVSEPDVLLMDEPFSSLDALSRESAQALLYEVWLAHRMTTILVTHSIEEAVFLCHTVMVLSGKRPGSLTASFRIQRPSVSAVNVQKSTQRQMLAFRQSESFFKQVNAVRNALQVAENGGDV